MMQKGRNRRGGWGGNRSRVRRGVGMKEANEVNGWGTPARGAKWCW